MSLDQRVPRVKSTRSAAGPLGMAGYARALVALKRTPLSTEGLSRALRIGRTAACPLLASLHALHLVHISGWEQRDNTPTVPRYSLGQAADAAAPATRPSGRPAGAPRIPRVRRPRAEIVSLANLVRALESPISKRELVAHCGIGLGTTRAVLRVLHAARLVHVSAWVATGRAYQPAAYWMLGKGPDEPRPARQAPAVTQQRYRIAAKAKAQARALAGPLP